MRFTSKVIAHIAQFDQDSMESGSGSPILRSGFVKNTFLPAGLHEIENFITFKKTN